MSAPTTGAKFATEVRANYVLNESQEVLVDTVADTIDIIAKTRDVTERRAQRIVLLRALAALGLPDAAAPGEVIRPSSTTTKARRAANARWRREVI